MQPTTATLASGGAAGAFVAIICWVLSEYAIVVPVNVALAMAVALTWAWGNVFHRPTSIPDNVVQMPTKGFTLFHTALTFVVGGLFLGCLIALSGCSAINSGVSAGVNYLGASAVGAKKNIEATNDLALSTWAAAGCATPYGAMVRNATGIPTLPEALVHLCGLPSGITVVQTTAAATVTVGTGEIKVPTATTTVTTAP